MSENPPGGADWYEVVEAGTGAGASHTDLEQGDLLRGFPFAIPVGVATGTPELQIAKRDVVVLTQTCDIPKPTQQTILLAKLESYDSLCRNDPIGFSKSKSFRESLVNGQNVAYFLLHERQGRVQVPWTVISFRELAVSSKSDVFAFANDNCPRLRLRSPYKEHLAQGFARFMMRVGLPLTAHGFTSYTPR